MINIALVYTEDRKDGVTKALKLYGKNPVRNKKVLLKPNFNTADPPPASTSMETLRSLILNLKEMGAKEIIVAERSGPVDTEECFTAKGLHTLADELDFSVINLSSQSRDDYILYKPEQSHWKDGFLFSKLYYEAECIVETCNVKTHRFGGHFTLSLKNAIGLVPRHNYSYMNELHSSPHQRKMIAEVNTAFSPSLIVMDGVDVFVDGGPDKGTKKEANVMLVGADRIAIDAIGVAILRMLGTTNEVSTGAIFDQEQIHRAVELGIGVQSPSEIKILTDSKKAEKLAEQIRAQFNKRK
jgi:uncharacterized protein (DUF362 family)